MNGQNAPENAEALVLMTKRISLDKKIVSALKDGDIEKIKEYLGDEGDISEFAVALGYAKDTEVLDFVLKNANVDYEQEIWAGLITRYSTALSDADKKDEKEAVHNKYLAMAKVLIQNNVEPRFVDILSPFNALQRAANAKLTKLAIYLIEECGADVDAVPYNSLTLEQRIEHYKTKRKFIGIDDEGDDLPSDEILQEETWASPLIYACTNKDKELCECLVKHGANVNYVRRWNFQGKWYETTAIKEAGKSRKLLEILKAN